ncbi:MAG TPA: hypothetical protein VMT70_14570 [Vicinamibacteria bacterium]|nr:hypothetical protein [Vicinamibacteria bacterium]
MLLALTLLAAATGGPRAALARPLPSPGASPWRGSTLSAALALAIGILAGGLLVAARWGRDRGVHPPQKPRA